MGRKRKRFLIVAKHAVVFAAAIFITYFSRNEKCEWGLQSVIDKNKKLLKHGFSVANETRIWLSRFENVLFRECLVSKRRIFYITTVLSRLVFYCHFSVSSPLVATLHGLKCGSIFLCFSSFGQSISDHLFCLHLMFYYRQFSAVSNTVVNNSCSNLASIFFFFF